MPKFHRNSFRFPLVRTQLAHCVFLLVMIHAWERAGASLGTGFHLFLRPTNSGVAISVQAIVTGDYDTGQVPIFVGAVDAMSAHGATITRTNDWLYYQPADVTNISDSFHYVLTNLNQQSASGLITVLRSATPIPNLLTISNLGNAGKLINFSGAIGSYSLQASSNLQTWQPLASRLAWPAGAFSVLDAATNSNAPQKFYRAATGELAPAITNYLGHGIANVQVDFQLGIEGGAATNFPATILSLPSTGYLFQDDGTALNNAPVAVTGPNGSLHYFGLPNGSGSNYASFNYKITRPSDGLDSLPANYQISLAPDVPAFTGTFHPVLPEDLGGLIQLTGSDPDLRYASNHLSFQVIFAPVIGTLYQVNPDGSPNFGQAMPNFTFVSNTNGWVYYQPPPLRSGGPFDSITVQVANNFDGTSLAILVPIDIYFVNHSPVANSAVFSSTADNLPLLANISVGDPDDNLVSVCFTALPARGSLHFGMGAPGVDIPLTASNNCFSIAPNTHGIAVKFLTDSEVLGPNSDYNDMPCYPNNNDIGSPYANATYVITDVNGASATNVIVFNVEPSSVTFSLPSNPASYTSLINTGIVINFTTTNSTGADTTSQTFTIINTLPVHGALFWNQRQLTQVPGTFPRNLSLIYVPNPDYYSSRDGADIFLYQAEGPQFFTQCNSSISLRVIAPPVIKTTGQFPIVELDENGNLATPGFVNWLSITQRDAPTNAILKVVVSGTPQGIAPYGYFAFHATNGLASFQSNGPVSVQFTGTTAAINTVLAAGFDYYSTPGSSASAITATLNDMGTTGLGTNTSSVSMSVYYGGTVIGP